MELLLRRTCCARPDSVFEDPGSFDHSDNVYEDPILKIFKANSVSDEYLDSALKDLGDNAFENTDHLTDGSNSVFEESFDSDELVDLGAVDEVVRNAIALASPNYNISKWLMDDPQSAGRTSVQGGQSAHGGQGHVPATNHMSAVNERITSTASQLAQSANQYAAPANQFAADFSQSAAPQLYTSSPIQQGPPIAKSRTSQMPKERLPRPEGVFEPIEARQAEQSFQSAMSPIKPPRSAGDKRLLVKVIKASGLGPKETGQVEPVCLLLLDDPVQNYSTSAVKNTINPFWDEHFLFDVTNETRELRLEVYDRAKAPGEEFIGESVIFIDDLRKTPSTRQILALQSKPGYVDSSCGSLTVEFLFMDPSEADLLLDISAAASNQISPKRRIETGRTITPGGTVVTTTTTTTEKSPFASQDPGLDGSPHLVQKHHVNADYSSSECSGGRTSPFVLTNDNSSMSASSGNINILTVFPPDKLLKDLESYY
ncbi:hypothetical protein LOTGIDRAFT_157106 [Lottia gigantea]|uniref:C2 domain-containing protein n=1 Tax=Lottia gigantea TaxID=225164 RepID=V4B8C4_LOTGI|nr:hypothetical protein LOTGIDRAFT_157106 [Lottia gigantea]ESP01972.1 hypothetical protein LOTGIDRAFT_157106 [Lottia gigantea]